jgi:CheY-like chemotaxis protein
MSRVVDNESSEDLLSSFTLDWPACLIARQMNHENHTPSKSPTQNDAAEISAARPQPCVLLVEDDRSVRRYLEVTLQRSGYRVVTAGDGLEAMKLALSNEIDVVVTDAIMPHLSGQELARFLRSNAKVSSLPIILLTGQENNEAAGAVENLIDAFLYKPVNAKELTNCLARLLGQHS